MSEIKNIILCGVGGQGTILASKILSTGLLDNGYDVKMSEVHGMAQRGGSVTTQVRYGKKVYSPIIGKASADVLISFEEMEASRWLEFVKPDGTVIINNFRIAPAPILTGKIEYPNEGIEDIKSKIKNTIVIKAAELARDTIGNPRTMNVIMLGALVKATGLDEIDWEDVISKTVKENFIEINKKAFKLGYSFE